MTDNNIVIGKNIEGTHSLSNITMSGKCQCQ